ncbi:MAG: hypothetical protein N0A16_12195 [Blastocatellia bacterium]|nr:hypothetical protein [Blastocatellia bacterium]MCS7158473.1 hypothetical protein [Blastocatellia bacterium]MCX7753456.1 hypothetical protein [Blastocatellia bacterium]MDW8167846.1 hypothetical protein [Acidobacteriota bacterium]MDW8255881.1 hypothetical protein [Acidobacteriota bacterium]
MNAKTWTVAILFLALIYPPVWGRQASALVVRLAVSGDHIAEKTLSKGARPGRLSATPDGRLIFTDFSDAANNEVFIADVSVTPPIITKVTDTATLRAKVDAENGGDPAPAVMTLQTVEVDEDGHIIILTDGGGDELAYLFRVDPRSGEVALISGLDRPFMPIQPISSIEGNRSMAVLGTTAYILLNDRFGAFNGDSIVKIDVHAPDGGRTAASELVSQAQLEAVIGVGQDIDLNDAAVWPSRGTLVVINSGRAQATDDLLEVDPRTGKVSLLVAATDIEADLGIPDVGYSGVDVGSDDAIYLLNTFGTSGHPATRGIIAIRNAGGGKGDATLFASEAEILANPSIRNRAGSPVSRFFHQNAGFAVSLVTGEVFFVDSSGAAQTNAIIGVRRLAGR